MLDAAGVEIIETDSLSAAEVKALSLAHTLNGNGATAPPVFSEAYPPDNALQIIESQKPSLIDPFYARSTFRAAYEGRYKLVQAENAYEALYDLEADPYEGQDLDREENQRRLARLRAKLGGFVERARARRSQNVAWGNAEPLDKDVLERLRGLGYIQ
jgi:hypothetical protein